ncbi:MAG: hypothetical protein IMZ61_15320 [Planctomycetes bacterium]|nr:hypothetical protein [Planctomycetota bacterium]
MAKQRISVPSNQVDNTRALIALPAELHARFVDVLAKMEVYSSARDLAKKLSKELESNYESLLSICRLFIALHYSFVFAPSTSQVIESLSGDIVQSCKDLRLAAEDYNWDLLKTTIERTLSLSNSPFAFLAQANKASIENNLTVATTDVDPDIRPLFSSKPEEGPKCRLIIHKLKVRYMEAGFEKRLVFSLDHRDLTVLQSQIMQSLAKEDILRKTQEGLGINTIDYFER